MENASDNFPQQKVLENLLPNFAGSSPPILPKTSPTSLWKLLVLFFRHARSENTPTCCLPMFKEGREKRKAAKSLGERQSIAQKGVRTIDARFSQLEMANMLQKPVFVQIVL